MNIMRYKYYCYINLYVYTKKNSNIDNNLEKKKNPARIIY